MTLQFAINKSDPIYHLLLSLIKYIHLNPVRANIAKAAGEYRWSSHRSYDKQKNNDIVDTDQVLRMFSEDKSQARKLYIIGSWGQVFNLDILKEPEVKVGSPLFTKIQKIDKHLTAASIGSDNPP